MDNTEFDPSRWQGKRFRVGHVAGGEDKYVVYDSSMSDELHVAVKSRKNWCWQFNDNAEGLKLANEKAEGLNIASDTAQKLDDDKMEIELIMPKTLRDVQHGITTHLAGNLIVNGKVIEFGEEDAKAF